MEKKRKKKPFKDTLVGSSLIGIASLINPNLGKVLNGATTVQAAIKSIGESDATVDEKLMLQEFALRQFEAEVQDRTSARQREAVVAASGGSDILFKVVGYGVTAAFLGVIGVAIGIFGQVPEEAQRLFDMGFGATVTAFASVVSYYFGSSAGSKQKTMMMNEN